MWQVNCAATGSIVVRLIQLTPVANGYAKLALLNVAGSDGITSVAFAPAGTQVRPLEGLTHAQSA